MNNAVVFLTHRPTKELFDFAKSLSSTYSVFICVDDNNFRILNKSKIVNVIQYPNDLMIDSGFYGANVLISSVSAWDKSVYHFVYNNIYDNVWFIEDDVYFYNVNSLKIIDDVNVDLVCSSLDEFLGNSWYKTEDISKYFSGSFYHSFIPICRLSSRLLFKIGEFVDEFNCLTFFEVLFPTILINNNLTYTIPISFKNVRYKKVSSDFDKNGFYHPVKDFKLQTKMRDLK